MARQKNSPSRKSLKEQLSLDVAKARRMYYRAVKDGKPADEVKNLQDHWARLVGLEIDLEKPLTPIAAAIPIAVPTPTAATMNPGDTVTFVTNPKRVGTVVRDVGNGRVEIHWKHSRANIIHSMSELKKV